MTVKKILCLILGFMLLLSATACKNGDDLSSNSQNNIISTKVDKSINMEEKYGFNSIETVEYNCVKDIPYGDAEYEITGVLTDKGSDVGYVSDITCDDKGVTVNEKVVTIPYEYKKKHDSQK